MIDYRTEAKIRNIAEIVIPHYGERMQCIVAAEELGELQKEIFKHLRGKDNKQAIVEEMADVIIMLCQLKMITGINSLDIKQEINKKLERQLKRVKAD